MVHLQQFVLFVGILLSVAFFSLFERKVMAASQSRVGPNKVGSGVLQPFADALKLVMKTESSPSSSVKPIYFVTPMVFFSLCLIMWVVYSSEWVLLNFSKSVLFILVCFSLTSYGSVLTGWFSNSKYAILGCGRALCQSISYEVGLSTLLIMLCCCFCSASLEFYLNLQQEVKLIFPLFFAFVMTLLVVLSELNRSPFDLAEGESELVSGYSVEYGGLGYTFIFLSENVALLWSCYLLGVLFCSYLMWLVLLLMVFIRTSLPRIRFDKMMTMLWVKLLPLVMSFFIMFIQVV